MTPVSQSWLWFTLTLAVVLSTSRTGSEDTQTLVGVGVAVPIGVLFFVLTIVLSVLLCKKRHQWKIQRYICMYHCTSKANDKIKDLSDFLFYVHVIVKKRKIFNVTVCSISFFFQRERTMNYTDGRQGMNGVNRDRVRIRRTILLFAILDNYTCTCITSWIYFPIF